MPPAVLNVLNSVYDILRFPDQASLLSWLRLSHFSDFNPEDTNAHCVDLIAIWGFTEMDRMFSGHKLETFFSRYINNLFHKEPGSASRVRKIAWKTTRKLSSFLGYTWLSGLRGGAEFSPERFFGSKAEGGKFRDYIEKLNKRLDNLSGGSKIGSPPMGGHERAKG
jgi:hypothetical protein